MSKFSARTPLAVAAVAASALAGITTDEGAAWATPTDGTGGPDSVTTAFGYRVSTVGGGYADVNSAAEIGSLAWAGQGGRMAFTALDTGIYTADPDGSHVVQVMPPTMKTNEGVAWDASSQNIIWGMAGTLVEAPANGDFAAKGLPPVPVLTGSAAAAVANYDLSSPQAASDADQSIVFQTASKADPFATGVALATVVNGVRTVTEVVPPATGPNQQYRSAATSPAISPDGKTIAFVRLVANDSSGTTYSTQLFSTTLGPAGWGAPVEITFPGPATSFFHLVPVFESDGKTVVFGDDSAHSVHAVDITQAIQPSGTTPGSNPSDRTIAAQAGSIAVRHEVKAHVQRFAGTNRFETAIQASQATWADKNAVTGRKALSVTLSRADLFADALGGAGLAAHKNGPLLLTSTTSLTPATQTEIQRVLPRGGTVYLLGGDAAISPAVTATLTGLGYNVQRITGANRYETAVAIADATSAAPKKILVATGQKFPDALSAGAVAAAQDNTVVVLTADNALPPATAAYLRAKSPGSGTSLFAVGGQAKAALAGWTFTPLVGQTRYETSYLVAHEMFGPLSAVGAATGTDWPDALAGGAFMGTAKGPLLLVDPGAGLSQNDSTLIDVNRGSANSAYVFGGSAVLPHTVDTQLAAAVATAAGVTIQ